MSFHCHCAAAVPTPGTRCMVDGWAVTPSAQTHHSTGLCTSSRLPELVSTPVHGVICAVRTRCFFGPCPTCSGFVRLRLPDSEPVPRAHRKGFPGFDSSLTSIFMQSDMTSSFSEAREIDHDQRCDGSTHASSAPPTGLIHGLWKHGNDSEHKVRPAGDATSSFKTFQARDKTSFIPTRVDLRPHGLWCSFEAGFGRYLIQPHATAQIRAAEANRRR